MTQSRTYLVSGGSGDIGHAICIKLFELGHVSLVGYASNAAAAEETAKTCKGAAIALDLTNDKSIETAVERMKNEFPALAGAVLAASPAPVLAPFGRIDPSDMNKQWLVNVTGAQKLLAALVRELFRKNKSGSVVGILSEAMGSKDRPAMKNMGAYIISKYGLLGILRLLEAEYSWLDVQTVSPGFTKTKMLSAFDPRFLEIMEKQTPLLSPEDVANEVVEKLVPPESAGKVVAK